MVTQTPNITILGVGNILLTDEGFGVHVVKRLETEYRVSPAVPILDGGTLGMELLAYMEEVDRLILVDAIAGGGVPGTVYSFTHEEAVTRLGASVSVHEVGMQDILRIRLLQDRPIEEIRVIGAEPEVIEPGLEMTPCMTAAVEPVIGRIADTLTEWGVTLVKRQGAE